MCPRVSSQSFPFDLPGFAVSRLGLVWVPCSWEGIPALRKPDLLPVGRGFGPSPGAPQRYGGGWGCSSKPQCLACGGWHHGASPCPVPNWISVQFSWCFRNFGGSLFILGTALGAEDGWETGSPCFSLGTSPCLHPSVQEPPLPVAGSLSVPSLGDKAERCWLAATVGERVCCGATPGQLGSPFPCSKLWWEELPTPLTPALLPPPAQPRNSSSTE